jgi:nucleoside-diphosphate-sugar epimerase
MILVSGASGVVGNFVLAELERRQSDFGILRRNAHSILARKNVREFDLDSLGSINNLLGVIHLASPRSQLFDEVIRDEILPLTVLLGEPRLRHIVIASSQTVYGTVAADDPARQIPEVTCPSPECWYDIGKIVNEYQLNLRRREDKAFYGIALRFGLLFAGGSEEGRRAQFLPMLLRHYFQYGLFWCKDQSSFDVAGTSYSTGIGLARAFCDSLDTMYNGAVNFASGFVTWRFLLETVKSVTGRSYEIVTGKKVPHALALPQSRTELDCTVARSLFGSHPEPQLSEIVDRVWSELPQ